MFSVKVDTPREAAIKWAKETLAKDKSLDSVGALFAGGMVVVRWSRSTYSYEVIDVGVVTDRR
jgi:hypothetical protein